MELVAPLGAVYQAGTLSGNPLAMAAGIATLRALQSHPNAYEQLEARAATLAKGLCDAALVQVPLTVNRVGSMLTAFFTNGPVTNYASAKQADTQMFAHFFHALLERGVYLPPSQFEALFISLAHSQGEIEQTVQRAADALRQIRHGAWEKSS
jgi:glutamate-1-semialdehyde 2,1-aminomutase